MQITLTNNLLAVKIDSHGAELQSIVNSKTGHEYLWQGDKAFWGRRSPVLFPVVGAVWNGEYMMDGSRYAIGQHGFARDCEFEVMPGGSDNEAWFVLVASEDTLSAYPRRFRLEIGYALNGERLSVMWRVKNEDYKEMCFQIGAHPAFNYPEFDASDSVHGYFGFNNCGLRAQVIESKGCVGNREVALPLDGDGFLPVTADTFADDALILAGNQVGRASLLDKNRRPYVTLLFQSPLVGLWSPSPLAPFVCIEPWWGRCDRVGFAGEFSTREYVNVLAPGQEFRASYLVLFDDL